MYTITFHVYLVKACPNKATPYMATNGDDVSHVINRSLFALMFILTFINNGESSNDAL